MIINEKKSLFISDLLYLTESKNLYKKHGAARYRANW